MCLEILLTIIACCWMIAVLFMYWYALRFAVATMGEAEGGAG